MNRVWDTPGGIHPPANKRQSLTLPIGYPKLPERLVVPLIQHIGEHCIACVTIGQQVLKGELIGVVDGALGTSVHAPSSGIVSAIEARPVGHQSGSLAPCIEILTDGLERWVSRPKTRDYRQLAPSQLLERIAQSGICGLGGAGFPTATKLTFNGAVPISTIIINATECEPYVTADESLMRERADEIIAGIGIIALLYDNTPRLVIGIEETKPEACAALLAASHASAIEIVQIPSKYPSGGERQLIYTLTGKEVPSGRIPASIGILCINVATTYAIKRAIIDGEPLISRVVTVTGKACGTQRNYQTLIGTPVQHLLDHSGLDDSRLSKLIMGGPMIGFDLPYASVPVVKTSYCILAPDASELAPTAPERSCIRCGFCAEVCPVSLLPQQLLWHAKTADHQRLEEHNLFDCIECGACAYVCPSHIPLVQYYRASKGEIDAARADKANARQARQRFEFHQLRLARLEREKNQRRKARRAAAGSNPSPSSRIKAPKASIMRLSSADIIAAAQGRTTGKKPTAEQTLNKLRRNVSTLQMRLEHAERRLAAAAGETADKQNSLRATAEDARQKLHRGEQRLTEQYH